MSVRALLSLVVAAVSAGTFSLDPGGPVIVFRPATASAVESSADDDGVAMSVAVSSLSPEDRAKLLDQLGYTAARLEARLSPLADDLGDEDVAPLDELKQALAPRMPTLTAARALTQGSWTGAGLTVRVAASCAEANVASGERCAGLWDPDDDRPLVSRARFVAWAASRAAVLDLGSVDAVRVCATKLRPRTTAVGSSVALVVTDAELALADVPEGEQLRDAAWHLGRAMRAHHLEDEQHLDALARPPPKGRALSPFHVGATMIAVIPRLSSLTRPGAMTAEIESACGRPGRWIHRP